jgi:hypothetical protein
MLSFANKPTILRVIMLSVVMLNVIILRAVAPGKRLYSPKYITLIWKNSLAYMLEVSVTKKKVFYKIVTRTRRSHSPRQGVTLIKLVFWWS